MKVWWWHRAKDMWVHDTVYLLCALWQLVGDIEWCSQLIARRLQTDKLEAARTRRSTAVCSVPTESIGCKVGKWCDSYRHLSSTYEGESSSIEARKTPKNAITAKHFFFFHNILPLTFIFWLTLLFLPRRSVNSAIDFFFLSPSDWTSALRTLSEASCF